MNGPKASFISNSKTWQSDNRETESEKDILKYYNALLYCNQNSNIAHNFNGVNIASFQHESQPRVRNINPVSNPESISTVAVGKQGTEIQEISLENETKETSMLTREQKLLFSRLIFNAKEILFADSANSEVTKPEKASKWFEILMQLNSVGANIPDYKTIRDQEWSNMRRAVEKKVSR